jgi:hypothetical protein
MPQKCLLRGPKARPKIVENELGAAHPLAALDVDVDAFGAVVAIDEAGVKGVVIVFVLLIFGGHIISRFG